MPSTCHTLKLCNKRWQAASCGSNSRYRVDNISPKFSSEAAAAEAEADAAVDALISLYFPPLSPLVCACASHLVAHPQEQASRQQAGRQVPMLPVLPMLLGKLIIGINYAFALCGQLFEWFERLVASSSSRSHSPPSPSLSPLCPLSVCCFNCPGAPGPPH